MKKVLTVKSRQVFSLLLIFSFFFLNIKEGKACINPDTTITVTSNFSADFTEVEIRLGNLKFMTEQPNVFCSCSLGSLSTFFDHLEYVAFVETGTNNNYSNMEPWENTQAADDAWNNSQPNPGDWNGFIAEVINNGINPDEDVELVIRASTPPGFFVSISDLDSTLSISHFGTDAWDSVNEVLVEDHQAVRILGIDNSSLVYNEVSNDYFTTLDDAILTGIWEGENNLPFTVAPNPFRDVFQVSYSLKEASSSLKVNLYNVRGQLLLTRSLDSPSSGPYVMTMELSDGVLQKGMYFIEIVTEKGRGIQKLLHMIE